MLSYFVFMHRVLNELEHPIEIHWNIRILLVYQLLVQAHLSFTFAMARLCYQRAKLLTITFATPLICIHDVVQPRPVPISFSRSWLIAHVYDDLLPLTLCLKSLGNFFEGYCSWSWNSRPLALAYMKAKSLTVYNPLFTIFHHFSYLFLLFRPRNSIIMCAIIYWS